ncbi:MAG: hypothetical protein HYY52_05155 [Candidatus Melainabacteria bacterium]|nr:hypothetical protein [Candidatus Melainabacteria bacterium]
MGIERLDRGRLNHSLPPKVRRVLDKQSGDEIQIPEEWRIVQPDDETNVANRNVLEAREALNNEDNIPQPSAQALTQHIQPPERVNSNTNDARNDRPASPPPTGPSDPTQPNDPTFSLPSTEVVEGPSQPQKRLNPYWVLGPLLIISGFLTYLTHVKESILGISTELMKAPATVSALIVGSATAAAAFADTGSSSPKSKIFNSNEPNNNNGHKNGSHNRVTGSGE